MKQKKIQTLSCSVLWLVNTIQVQLKNPLLNAHPEKKKSERFYFADERKWEIEIMNKMRQNKATPWSKTLDMKEIDLELVMVTHSVIIPLNADFVERSWVSDRTEWEATCKGWNGPKRCGGEEFGSYTQHSSLGFCMRLRTTTLSKLRMESDT